MGTSNNLFRVPLMCKSISIQFKQCLIILCPASLLVSQIPGFSIFLPRVSQEKEIAAHVTQHRLLEDPLNLFILVIILIFYRNCLFRAVSFEYFNFHRLLFRIKVNDFMAMPAIYIDRVIILINVVG